MKLLDVARAGRWVLTTAESCTGGLIAHQITEISGSSSQFWGSWVVYDDTAKISLGVAPGMIAEHGAVSAQVAAALAENAARATANALGSASSEMTHLSPWKGIAAVATTGIAGPSGGTSETPVGLCYVGVALIRDGQDPMKPIIQTLKIQAPAGGSRSQNKEYFAEKTIELLLQVLSK